jgi:tryptophanyl-tRNA synthetase
MSSTEVQEEVGFPRKPGEALRVLTGVKPTGVPHIGNYFGAIKPAVDLSKEHATYLFIADLHALTTERDPKRLEEDTYSVAATWLACGVDPKKTVFFKQTDVPEVTTLAWILSCFTPKGLLERAHSYKDALQKGVDDESINQGVFSYPVLMAADILLYDADLVPVGKDQKQHLEITQEIARKVNNQYGPVLRVPRALIDERVMTIPGLDGKKMSKSYQNTIELFSSDKELKKRLDLVKTDSTEYGQPLKTEGEVLFQIYSLLASPEEAAAHKRRYEMARMDPSIADASLADPSANFFGWGSAKKATREKLIEALGPMRDEYNRLMGDKAHLRQLLHAGAERAREKAHEVLDRVERACGFVLG